MRIGIYPSQVQEKYHCTVGRRVVYASTFRGGTPYADDILLTVCNNQLHGYTRDPFIFAERTKKIYNALQPELIVIENEELLRGDIAIYCNELQAASDALPGKVTNGGLTLPELSYWYWNLTRDSEYFTHNIPSNQKDALVAGLRLEAIDKVAYEMSVLKRLQIASVNVHYYIAFANQVPGLVRMINYVKEWTGKPAVSNEAGVYSPELLKDCVEVAKQTGMDWLILYSGSGKDGQAAAITKTDFDSITAEI